MSLRVKAKWTGGKALKTIKQTTPKGLFMAGQVIARVSGQQVPLDTGALERTQAVEVDGQSVTISYDTPYAIKWHENDAHFQHGRKKKYLEDPMNDPAVRQNALEAMAREIKVD